MNYLPKAPFSSIDYKPELDTSMQCEVNQKNYFQNLISVLCWIVELDRIDIACKLFLLSKFLAKPLPGYIYQALHVFKYLEAHIKNELSFDLLNYRFHHFQDPNQLQSETNIC